MDETDYQPRVDKLFWLFAAQNRFALDTHPKTTAKYQIS
jgi:hypothetical protein